MGNSEHSYYSNDYGNVQRSGLQGLGNSLIDRLVEKYCSRNFGDRILEIGAGSGEHLKYVSNHPEWSEYICLDLAPGITNPNLFQLLQENQSSFGKVKFVKANAENIPYPDDAFDLVISTCVLAHAINPEKVLSELRRVIRSEGLIVIGMPCDPGMLNRLIKRLITFPKMKKNGIQNPALIYAREHRNPIHNLKTLISANYSEDKIQFKWFPFKVPYWNFQLVLICRIIIFKSEQV